MPMLSIIRFTQYYHPLDKLSLCLSDQLAQALLLFQELISIFIISLI